MKNNSVCVSVYVCMFRWTIDPGSMKMMIRDVIVFVVVAAVDGLLPLVHH